MDKAPARTPARTRKTGRRLRNRPGHASEGGLRIGRRNVILLALALLAIGGGFVFLAAGSTIVSAILLVGGYLGLVPWAILARDRSTGPANGPAGASGGGSKGSAG